MSRVRSENLLNFTGGLNLRADAFELGEGESPSMLNVDVDPRGGFVARQGMTRLNASVIGAPWDPRTLFVHETATGDDNLFLVSDTIRHSADDGSTWTDSLESCDASPHGASFAPWGDLVYVGTGHGQSALKADTIPSFVTMTDAGAATWSPYNSPVTCFPRAEFVASHQGYMFAASTYEDGASYEFRIRWSHPNNPEAWLEDDEITIKEGGGPITALVPNRDHVLVFQQSAVWALYGFNSDNWNLVNVSRELGAQSAQVVARSESQVFFYAHPHGVYKITGDTFPVEISAALRPAIEGPNFNKGAIDNSWLGWLDQKLWWSCPYWEDGTATDARTTFVWDPTLGGGNGAWTVYRAGDEYGVGPFGQGSRGGGGDLALACARSYGSVMHLNDNNDPVDDINGTPVDVAANYTTRWMDAGYPTLKKSWRRPDIIAKERTLEYELTLEAFKDYEESNVERTKVLTVESGGTNAVWGGFVWGDGTVYGPPAKGSVIERSGSIGPARSVQLRVSGTAGKPWGVDAIVFKFVPRRMR